jgi:ParB/RepB/Spo0J family partition protein
MSAAQTPTIELEFIPVSKITIEDGHNPRGEVKIDEEFKEFANTVKELGVHTPVLTRRRGDEFVLIAGERRWRAAVAAKLATIPSVVYPESPEDDSRQARARRKQVAIVENFNRAAVDPLGLAGSFADLRDAGYSDKEIAAAIGKKGADGPAFVRKYLRLLELPNELQTAVDTKAIPVKAVAALADLAALHPELSTLAVQRVLSPPEDFDPADRLSWDDFTSRPIATVSAHFSVYGGGEPDGVYTIGENYSLDNFELPELANKHLEQIREAFGAITGITLNEKTAERAAALSALHRDNQRAEFGDVARIVVGHDLASQLVADQIADRAKEARAEIKRRKATKQAADERRAALAAGTRSDSAAAATGDGDASADASTDEDDNPDRQAEDDRLRREADAERRRVAESFNEQLGAAVTTRLATLRADVRIVKILVAVDLDRFLGDIAYCGARLCLPGWYEEKSSSTDSRRARVYIATKAKSAERAAAWLSNAEKIGEVCGRAVSLAVLATFADQYAVADSYRSPFVLKPAALPWADQTHDLIDDLVIDVLGETLLGEKVAERRRERAEQRAAREAQDEARTKLLKLVDDLDNVSDEDLAAMPALAIEAFGRGYDGDWVERDRILRTIDKQVATRRTTNDEQAEKAADDPTLNEDESKAALARVLDRLGEGLGLDELDDAQLGKVAGIADDLEPAERDAVLAAIDHHRERTNLPAAA